MNRILIGFSLAFLGAVSASAQSIEAGFSIEKTDYLVGEPIFVTLAVTNKTGEPIWLEFQSPDSAKLCADFVVEVPGAEPANEPWGCGFAGSCGRGLRQVLPGKTIRLRQLVNHEFRLLPGAYSLHAQTSIVVRKQDLFDSPKSEQVDVSNTLQLSAQSGNESKLESAFKPIVAELDNRDPMRRAEAAGAITELAPPFLEDILIELTKTNFAYSALAALRKADTPKTRAALAQIATRSDNSTLRIEAIRNLGRTKDIAYLPTLFHLMESQDKPIQNAAAEAAGILGGRTAIQRLSTFVFSANAETRIAGASALGGTRAREAVPILIRLLLDSDSNVRQAAVNNLSLLTHHAAFDGNQWAGISTTQSAVVVYQRWVQWWGSHGATSEIHGIADCSPSRPLD